jgi:hypothetical protein
LNMEIPKTGFPNFFACKPLIFPNRAKKIFAEIWSVKFRAIVKCQRARAPWKYKFGLVRLGGIRPLWPRRARSQKARRL